MMAKRKIAFYPVCPDCGKPQEVPLIKHHILTKDMVKYLNRVNKPIFGMGELTRLRRQLVVFICKKCEDKFHNKD